MAHHPQPQAPPLPTPARDREPFVQVLIAELRRHQVLSDPSYEALLRHMDELTEPQLVALLQAMGVWPRPLHSPSPNSRDGMRPRRSQGFP